MKLQGQPPRHGRQDLGMEASAGGSGNDTLWVETWATGNVTLFGNAGEDRIGGAGSDWLNGAAGNDWLDGGRAAT